jgi:hypothetical protein
LFRSETSLDRHFTIQNGLDQGIRSQNRLFLDRTLSK